MDWLSEHHRGRRLKAQAKALRFGVFHDAWVDTYARHARFERLGK